MGSAPQVRMAKSYMQQGISRFTSLSKVLDIYIYTH